MLRLGAIVDEAYAVYARRYLGRLAPAAIDNPFGFGLTIGALDRLVRGSTDVVILGDTKTPQPKRCTARCSRSTCPIAMSCLPTPTRRESMEAARGLTADKPSASGARGVAYVCR